jgi:hypothetical protein
VRNSCEIFTISRLFQMEVLKSFKYRSEILKFGIQKIQTLRTKSLSATPVFLCTEVEIWIQVSEA